MQTSNTPSKKRKYTKKRTYKKKANPNTYANKMIKKLIKNKEYKVVDQEATDWLVTTATGQLNYVLNLNKMGTAFYNRVGNKFTMKSIHIRLQLFPNILQPLMSQDLIRVLLVYDRNPNKQYPLAIDILKDTDLNGNSTVDSWSFPNPSNKSRFKIIRDWSKFMPEIDVGVLNQGQMPYYVGGGTNKGGIYFIDEYIKLKDLPTCYEYNVANTGTMQELQTGALYLIALKSQQTGEKTWELEYNSRLIFEDA